MSNQTHEDDDTLDAKQTRIAVRHATLRIRRRRRQRPTARPLTCAERHPAGRRCAGAADAAGARSLRCTSVAAGRRAGRRRAPRRGSSLRTRSTPQQPWRSQIVTPLCTRSVPCGDVRVKRGRGRAVLQPSLSLSLFSHITVHPFFVRLPVTIGSAPSSQARK